jgi:3-phenylpropionate/cinnamic acid dioxygenase small subunit
MTRVDAETVLYREAYLMDEHRYEDWLALWDETLTYWVPCGGEGKDPKKEVSIIYDDRTKLQDRIARFLSGDVISQDPPRPMRRVVSNVEVLESSEGRVALASNFMLVQAGMHDQVIWAGRSTHHLRRRGNDFAMSFKKVVLVNNSLEMPSLQFLV